MDLSFLNKNRHLFVETDPALKITHKLFSASALNAFIEHNSSPRGLMMNSHIAQSIVLSNPDPEIVQTGLEAEFGKYVIAKVIEKDVEVIAVIKRYSGLTNSEVTEHVLIYREIESGIVDAIEIPYYNTYHPYFGFKYNKDEKIDEYVRGDIIPKDTYIATPPTYIDKGVYGYGKNINVAQMTLPGVDEDGFVVSKSFLKKFKFKLFEKRTIEVGENSYLLNLYGDENEYKPFPKIGEYINETGIVAASRKFDQLFTPTLMSKNEIRKPNPIFDNCVYTRGPGGKIVDIKVYKNSKKKRYLPSGTEDLFDKYATSFINFHKQIIDIYESINSEYYRMFNKNVEIGNKLHIMLVEAYGIVDSEENPKLKKMYRKEILDLYRVEFVIEYEITPTTGFKPSDKHGGKGTIVQVWDDEDMPIDKDGNRADMIVDPRSTIGRLNIGRLYERYIKAASRKAQKIIKDMIKVNPESLSDQEVIEIFKVVLEFVDIFENELTEAYHGVFKTNNISAMREIIIDIVENEFYLYTNIDDEKRKYEVVADIKKSRFAPVKDTVKFKYDGILKESDGPVMIAPMYIILLSKIADTGLVTSSAKVNHFGLPIVVSKFDKYKLPYRNSPTRTIGETEGRIFAAYGGREFLAELVDRNASIQSHGIVYGNILRAEKPTNTETFIDREQHPYGTHRGLEILNSLWNSVGMELKWVPDKHPEYEPYEGEYEIISDVDKIEDAEEIGLDKLDIENEEDEMEGDSDE